MSVAPLGLPWFALAVLQALQLAALAVALRYAPWRELAAVPLRVHLVFGALLGLVLLWLVAARPIPLLHVHLLGMTAVTLTLGPALAVLVGAAAQVVVDALGGSLSANTLADAMLNATLPALITALALRVAMQRGPRNLFVYMLGVGFFGGGLAMLATGGAVMLLAAFLGVAGAPPTFPVLLVLLMLPEAFVNGAIVTGLAVYAPDLMKTFSERHFLPSD